MKKTKKVSEAHLNFNAPGRDCLVQSAALNFEVVGVQILFLLGGEGVDFLAQELELL